ncbi:hypothetical protein BH23CHL8_BH23CHL8_10510 [soil metagenome]
MGEYGGVVGQGSSAGGGGFGDVGKAVTGSLSDVITRIAALPPEILLVAVAAILIGGLLVLRRT